MQVDRGQPIPRPPQPPPSAKTVAAGRPIPTPSAPSPANKPITHERVSEPSKESKIFSFIEKIYNYLFPMNDGEKEILNSIMQLNENVTELKSLAENAKQAEQSLTGVSIKTYDDNKEHYNNVNHTYIKAETELNKLKGLREKSSKNGLKVRGSLLKEISRLEENVTFHKGRVNLMKQLLDVENLVNIYKTEPKKSWSNFERATSARKELMNIMKDNVPKDPDYNKRKDSELLNKSNWDTEEVTKLIKKFYPAMTSQWERIATTYDTVREARVNHLNELFVQNPISVKTILNDYKEQIQKFYQVGGIFSSSGPSEAYFEKKAIYEEKVKKLNEKQAKQKVKKGRVNPKEIENATKEVTKAKNEMDHAKKAMDTAKGEIQQSVIAFSEIVKAIDPNEINWLREYNTASPEEKKTNILSELKRINDFKTRLEVEKHLNLLVSKEQPDIGAMQDLLKTLHMHAAKYKKTYPKFNNSLDELKYLLPNFYPSLQKNTDRLMAKVNKMTPQAKEQLIKELNQGKERKAAPPQPSQTRELPQPSKEAPSPVLQLKVASPSLQSNVAAPPPLPPPPSRSPAPPIVESPRAQPLQQMPSPSIPQPLQAAKQQRAAPPPPQRDNRPPLGQAAAQASQTQGRSQPQAAVPPTPRERPHIPPRTQPKPQESLGRPPVDKLAEGKKEETLASKEEVVTPKAPPLPPPAPPLPSSSAPPPFLKVKPIKEVVSKEALFSSIQQQPKLKPVGQPKAKPVQPDKEEGLYGLFKNIPKSAPPISESKVVEEDQEWGISEEEKKREEFFAALKAPAPASTEKPKEVIQKKKETPKTEMKPLTQAELLQEAEKAAQAKKEELAKLAKIRAAVEGVEEVEEDDDFSF